MVNRRRFWPSFISPLSARILAIMLLPLALFLVGLFSVDQYRHVLIAAELDALERQGRTLARSLALAEAEQNPFAQRQLSSQTMRHLLPLVGYGSELRARVFQPTGALMADTFQRGASRSLIRMQRKTEIAMRSLVRIKLVNMMNGLAASLSNRPPLPVVNIRGVRRAELLPEIMMALRGDTKRTVWRNPDGQLVLAVSLPIQDLRVVRGALLLTTTGGGIEQEIGDVQWAFVQLFAAILGVTVALGLYLSRSITRPIVQLASSADQLRMTRDTSLTLRGLPDRKDEIGQLSQALSDMTAELQRRIEATAGFAADVAHELKNPLTSLRSAVETVSRIEDPAQQSKLMDIILADVQRLDRLITDISQASRVDAELSILPDEAEDFAALLASWVQLSRERHNQVVFTLYKTDRPVPVRLHTGRIIQILDNLLANAVTFNPEGKPINIHLQRKRTTAVVTMRDHGPGLPPGKQEKIFERFYTERPASEGFGIHSGLGLSISRQIAIAHGGILGAETHPEGGALFTLTLPLASIKRKIRKEH